MDPPRRAATAPRRDRPELNGIVAILPYPPSAALRERLRDELGAEPEYVTLTQVGRLRSLATLLELRQRFRGYRALVVVEDEASLAAIPVLHGIAAVAGATRTELLAPGTERRRLGTLELIRGATGTIVVSVTWALFVRRRRERMLEQLVALQRANPPATDSRRVLYLNSNLWFGLKAGGSVAHVAGVVNGLRARGFDIDFFGPGEAPLVGEDVQVHRLQPPMPLALRQEANVERFQQHAVAETRRSSRPPYAFLYQRNSIASYAGVVASRRAGAPLVLEYNGSEVWTSKRWGYGLRYERIAVLAEEASLRHAELVVTVSEVSRDELVERGVDPARVLMYPNGVDADRYRPDLLHPAERAALLARYGIAADALVVGFIGTFGQWHGVDVLAKAIVQLADESRQLLEEHDVHFLLVGDGLRMPEVEATLLGRAAAARTTLVGLVPQTEGAAYLAASDVLVSPHVPNPDGTRFFGSPTKLFEYMATGRAIVASDLEQVGEVLQPALRVGDLPSHAPTHDAGELAVLAEPGDAGELVAGLRWTIEQTGWRSRLGANARARALARHTWEHHVDAILGALERLR